MNDLHRGQRFLACRKDNPSIHIDGFYAANTGRIYSVEDPQIWEQVNLGDLVLVEPSWECLGSSLVIWHGTRAEFEQSPFRMVGFDLFIKVPKGYLRSKRKAGSQS